MNFEQKDKAVFFLRADEVSILRTCITFTFNLLTMRRLHQSILIIVTVVSLLGFLLYKHEYDRLSNVLHVLHTFSQSSCEGKSGDGLQSVNGGLGPSALQGIWQKIGPVFTFSAVWDGSIIKIFAIIPATTSVKEIRFTKCLIRSLESSGKHSTFEESLSIELETIRDSSDSDLKWRTVFFNCKFPISGVNPYAVSLSGDRTKNSSLINELPLLIPILRSTPIIPRAQTTNSTIAICASISSQEIQEPMLKQFVEFHSYIGVNRITFYDFGVSPEVLRWLSATSSSSHQTKVQILPWNFPSESREVALNVMKRECTFRHSDHHFNVLLNVNQLIVPRFHSHLNAFIQDEAELDDSLGLAKIQHKVFCMDFESNAYVKLATSYPMLLKTYWVQPDDDEKDEAVIVNPRAVKSFIRNGAPVLKPGHHELHVDAEIVTFHTYKVCGENASYAHFDNIIVRKFGNQFAPILNA